MSGINVCIWKLEKSLKEIKGLLQNDFRKPIEQLMNCEIPNEEKYLVNKWIATEGSYDNKVYRTGDKNINYMQSTAFMEISYGNLFMPDGTPLPKENRVNSMNSHILFAMCQDTIYSIVYGSKSAESRIRGTLMLAGKKKKESEWGHVNFNNNAEYQFDKSFYYWILQKKGSEITFDEKTIKIIDVKGFKSSSDRDVHAYSGEGSNIDNEIPLRSIVGMDEKLKSIRISLIYNDFVYSFALDYDGRLLVKSEECGEFATENPRRKEIHEVLLDLYFDIIPFLRINFNKASIEGTLSDSERRYRRLSAMHIIDELMRQNNIHRDDIAR